MIYGLYMNVQYIYLYNYLLVHFSSFFWWIGSSLILQFRGHGIMYLYTTNTVKYCILIKYRHKIGSICLHECSGKLMEGLKTLKACCEMLISYPK